MNDLSDRLRGYATSEGRDPWEVTDEMCSDMLAAADLIDTGPPTDLAAIVTYLTDLGIPKITASIMAKDIAAVRPLHPEDDQ